MTSFSKAHPTPDGHLPLVAGQVLAEALRHLVKIALPAKAKAGRHLDMLLANSDRYRTNYTIWEETAAAEAGQDHLLQDPSRVTFCHGVCRPWSLTAHPSSPRGRRSRNIGRTARFGCF
jgi:hypothetical protein